MPTPHEMTVTRTLERGVEEWSCSRCARRLILRRPPEFEKIVLDRGDEVSVIDDLSTGSIDNIAHLKARPAFRYTIDSVTNEPLLAELIDGSDTVVHLAAAVGVKLIVEQPVRTIETNVHGTEVVLTQANKKKKKVLIASTSGNVDQMKCLTPASLAARTAAVACLSSLVPCSWKLVTRNTPYAPLNADARVSGRFKSA